MQIATDEAHWLHLRHPTAAFVCYNRFAENVQSNIIIFCSVFVRICPNNCTNIAKISHKHRKAVGWRLGAWGLSSATILKLGGQGLWNRIPIVAYNTEDPGCVFSSTNHPAAGFLDCRLLLKHFTFLRDLPEGHGFGMLVVRNLPLRNLIGL